MRMDAMTPGGAAVRTNPPNLSVTVKGSSGSAMELPFRSMNTLQLARYPSMARPMSTDVGRSTLQGGGLGGGDGLGGGGLGDGNCEQVRQRAKRLEHASICLSAS